MFSEGSRLMGGKQKLVSCVPRACQANIFTVVVQHALGFGAGVFYHVARYVLEEF